MALNFYQKADAKTRYATVWYPHFLTFSSVRYLSTNKQHHIMHLSLPKGKNWANLLDQMTP